MSVQNFYLNNDPQKYERRKIRAAFNKQRNLLKQQWENYYRLKWPQEKSYAIGTKTSKPATQKIIKKVHFNNVAYQAHHVIPINAGGINQVWNISPMAAKNHKLLHASIEEKSCFSHGFIHRNIMRFLLRIKIAFLALFNNADQNENNYAR